MTEVPEIPRIEPATYPGEMARWGLGALAVGGAGRLLKHVFDTARNRDIRTPITGKSLRSPVAEVPVEVSDEEAEQLRRQGLQVKQAFEGPDAPQDQGGGFLTGQFLRKAGLGALGTAGLMAGWKGVDMGVDYLRKSDARRRLEATKRRVERLLDADPMPQDAKIAGACRAVEDAVVAKVASAGGALNTVADYSINLPGINNLGYVAGPAALLSVLGAFQRAKATSKSEAAARQLAGDYEGSVQPRTPYLSLVPTQRARHPEEPKSPEEPKPAEAP